MDLALGRLALAALAGCVGPGIFDCHDDTQCGPEGRCEPSGYCSVPDPECGRRYSEYSPAPLKGQCVAGAGTPDGGDGAAGPDGSDASSATCGACPGACVDGVCTIDCSTTGCLTPVVCPDGSRCRIDCGPSGSCPAGIDCSQASSCDIHCTGDASCPTIVCSGTCTIDCAGEDSCDQVICGPGRCDVTCGGFASCIDLDCLNACACTTHCPWGCAPSCRPPPTCVEADGECTALPQGCDAC